MALTDPAGMIRRFVVVLWRKDGVACTCEHLPDSQIEICLTLNDVALDRMLFSDIDGAAAYAIAKMRDYDAR